MQKRLFGLLASAALVMSACGTAAPSASAPPASAPGSAAPPASEPPPSQVTGFTDDLLFTPAAYTPEEGKPGGSIVVSDWQTYSILNKYYTSSFKNSQVMAATWAPNWDISPDGKWIPELVTSVPNLSNGGVAMDSSGAGFTITLEYKPGLLWSDGKPLTMNDMKFTWEYIMDEEQVGLVSGTVGWDLIDKFDVSSDGLTGTIHFKEGYAGYYGLLGDGPMPKHYMETFSPAEAADKSYPVGTPELANAPTSGPFKYGAASADTLELLRNDNYKTGPHVAYLDKLIFKFYTDAKDAMIAAFLAKEVDVATDLLQGDYASIQGVDPAWGQALIGPAWEYEHLDLNQQNEAFKDAKVREAVARGIDKDALWDIVYPGVPKPVAACAPTPPGLYWRAEDLTCAEYDVEKAKALLTEAGWTDTNGDGTVDKGGKELELQHCSTPAPFRVSGWRRDRLTAQGDRHQGHPDLRCDPLRGLERHHPRDPVQHLSRDLRHGGVRLRPDPRHLRRLLLLVSLEPGPDGRERRRGWQHHAAERSDHGCCARRAVQDRRSRQDLRHRAGRSSRSTLEQLRSPALLSSLGSRTQQPSWQLREEPVNGFRHVEHRGLVRQGVTFHRK